MSQPNAFSWIEKPLLAALGRPESPEDLAWLRTQGIELLLSLTEDPPRRDWLEETGLLLFHVPVMDMEAPTPDQLDRAVSAIRRANDLGMGVAVHCGAGLGRTGVVLACYFVSKGLTGNSAIARIRRLRPGSIETDEQIEAILEYAHRQEKKD
ncbi:MAG: dual specificity protein phosphatase family protein [Planctomycetes bacterium]|nr:dual specificity protein phosphatase family protein [Planctomycetota bacterium]